LLVGTDFLVQVSVLLVEVAALFLAPGAEVCSGCSFVMAVEAYSLASFAYDGFRKYFVKIVDALVQGAVHLSLLCAFVAVSPSAEAEAFPYHVIFLFLLSSYLMGELFCRFAFVMIVCL
jgi:hypothetical protein